jgi:uncharacterized protein (DUF934 family)
MSTRTLRFVTAGNDDWAYSQAEAEATPAANRILTWSEWLDARGRWPAELPVGAVFPNDGDLSQLIPDLARLALIALPFPKWTDGRAYSLARTLRVRHRYAGQLRAIGDVIPDMAAQLHRTGFDTVVLRPGESIEVAERMLNFVPEFYQGDVQQPRIRFVREFAAETQR